MTTYTAQSFKSILFLLSWVSPMIISAFVVPSVEPPPTISTVPTTDSYSPLPPQEPAWRIALNLGREMMTPLWDSYGSSGIRFPVVVPCEFTQDGLVIPQTDTISYTASVDGAVSKPVKGGNWEITSTNENDNSKNLQFTLNFPEKLQKKDVVIPSQSTLVFQGVLYSQDDLKKMDEAFATARSEQWKAQEVLDDIYKIRDAPKKWNPETQKWEKQRMDEPLTSLISKHWNVMKKRQTTEQKYAAKPRSVNLSTQSGPFPGFDNNNNQVHMGVHGVIRNQKDNNKVVGTWSAEPIMKGVPKSYYRP